MQIREKKFSLISLYKLKHLNTLLGKQYLFIKMSNALSEPSLVRSAFLETTQMPQLP